MTQQQSACARECGGRVEVAEKEVAEKEEEGQGEGEEAEEEAERRGQGEETNV